jgi:hypothetical protein
MTLLVADLADLSPLSMWGEETGGHCGGVRVIAGTKQSPVIQTFCLA